MASKKKTTKPRKKVGAKLPPPKPGRKKRPVGRPSKTYLKRSAAARRGARTKRLETTLEKLARAKSKKTIEKLELELLEELEADEWINLYTRRMYDAAMKAAGEEPEGEETEQQFDSFFQTVLPSFYEGGLLHKRTVKELKKYLGMEVQVLVRGKVQAFITGNFREDVFELSRIIQLGSYRDLTDAISSMLRDYSKEVTAERDKFNTSPFSYIVEYVAFLPTY